MSRKGLKIKEWGGFGCYVVESESKPEEPYYVDLTQREGNGSCNCKFFQTKANPNYKRHKKFIPYNKDENGKIREGVSECKHVAVARNYFHIHVTQPMLAAYKGE